MRDWVDDVDRRLLFVVAAVLLAGCAGKPEYHCAGGKVVGDPAECPAITVLCPDGLTRAADLSRCPMAAAEEANRSAAPEAAAAETTVVVVSTQHFITDMPDGYTPAHLRALLRRINPDVIALEAPANVPDPYSMAPYEASKVTIPWARENGIMTLPVGWHDPGYQAQIGRMVEEMQGRQNGAGLMAVMQANEVKSQQALAKTQTIVGMNSQATHQTYREYHATLHRLYGRDTPWEAWNERILDNLVVVCRDNTGKRIAVVFGGAHAYYLEDGLRRTPGIKLIPAEDFLPLDPKDVENETRPGDYLASLRLLNYDSVDPAVMPRLEHNLEAVGGYPEYAGDYRLFKSRLLFVQGRYPEALQAFQDVAKADAGAVSSFDGSTRLWEAGTVYSALAKARMGRNAEAKEELRRLISRQDVTVQSRQWAEQLLSSLEYAN